MLSSPMLFQTQGGLQIQILESVSALQQRGVDAQLINPNVQHLTEFDVIHVFSVINGNQRIAEHAKAFGLPVVTSPLIRSHWNRSLGAKARLLERAVGRLTRWSIKTEYREIDSCLQHSDILIALGETEKASIVDAFLIEPEKIRVVPNGIPDRFFCADPTAARVCLRSDEGFVLNIASINPHKNQLTLARATARAKRRLVLAGECLLSEQSYLEQILAFPHVTYVGKLRYDDPLLPSLYAAADVFCLPSQSEVMPLATLESLAAGTPVVTTRHHCMNLSGMRDFIEEVEPNNEMAILDSIELISNRDIDHMDCQTSVKRYSWNSVAQMLHEAYTEALDLGNSSQSTPLGE
ncbi:glycosyltransferase family 4 protein [Nitrosospira multiformis]|nr:glycosyltransferase family 4 protein [Nitrosospira multiformis]